METGKHRIVVAITLAWHLAYSAFGQGALSPTAAPAPTMKTLAQIEPRTPITNLPYTISSSGSYYVTTNLTCTTCSGVQPGINFSLIPLADNVTLDLNGFTLSGMAGSGHGISASGGYNYVIRNGTLANWGEDGVDMSLAANSRFENLQFYGNGHIGLEAGVGSVVVNCEATANTVAGFSMLSGDISHCAAVGNGTGIVASTGCVVADCAASGNNSTGFLLAGTGVEISHSVAIGNTGIGILTSNGCVVADCTASGNSSDGINAGVGTGVRGCASYQNAGNGVTTSSNCTVVGCSASGNSTAFSSDGISVGSYSTVKDCTASGNNFDGISVNSNNCQIVGNTCSGNAEVGIFVAGGQNRIDGNSIGNNRLGGVSLAFVNVTNSITRNFATGNGLGNYGNYSGNADYAPTGSVSTATNPWTNF
jgi:parallel beta-helix repeat protein